MMRTKLGSVPGSLIVMAVFLIFSTFPLRALAQGAAALRQTKPPADAVWVEDLGMEKMQETSGGVRAKLSYWGGPILLSGTMYPHGISSYGDSFIIIDLKGAAKTFMAMAGINQDVQKGRGSVIFQVWLDEKKVFETGVVRGGDKAQLVSVDLVGAKKMYLVADSTPDGVDGDTAVWGGAMLILNPEAQEKPEAMGLPDDSRPIIAHGTPPEPAIHGPRIVGATPGNPFLFMIPATGQGPLTFSAQNLPEGLVLDPETGIITGALKNEGRTTVVITVKGALGSAERKLVIVGGKHRLALTPPLGWNSWNVWAGAVDDPKVRAAADAMISSGLAAHGFQYVNIDDTWESDRDSKGEILTNVKFPDMKALADYVHSKGLKLGIYSSPGPKTCAGFEASYQHEFQDAATWAKWDIDYVKYDWCSYGRIAKDNSLEELKKPYTLMREALDSVNRDIVFSLCQYGMGDVWEWGAQVGGNLWRTTGDINDSWGSMSGIGFGQTGHEKFAGPGHWNDPDMLVVGRVGWGPSLHPTRLSPNEQVTHITLWSMLAAPLLIGCDMADMDQFTLDLLTNDDVLDVNQDPLGVQASRVTKDGMFEIWARPLWDGTMAVALFNKFIQKAEVTAKWSDLGINGSQPVRDLWQRKDLGVFDGSFTVVVPPHGAIMLKIGEPQDKEF